MIRAPAHAAPAAPTGTEPRPLYRLTHQGKDITARFQGRLINLTLTDNRGFEADQLDVELDDADGLLAIPEKGAVLTLALGWADSGVVDKGSFKVDEIEHSGPPDRLTLRARSADLSGDLTTRKERSFSGKSIGDIVRAVAVRNGLTPIIAQALDRLVIAHLDQTGESDVNLLTRLAQEHDAIATVKQGALLFIQAGEGMSAIGKPLPTVTITRASGDRHTFNVADRDNYNGVKAYYQDTRRARKGEVVIDASNAVATKDGADVGRKTKQQATAPSPDPDNLKVLRHTYASKTNAERAARAEWQRIQRGVATFSITLARGRPELFPELPAVVRGWKPEIDGSSWTLARVTHRLGDEGFVTELELELKLADAGP